MDAGGSPMARHQRMTSVESVALGSEGGARAGASGGTDAGSFQQQLAALKEQLLTTTAALAARVGCWQQLHGSGTCRVLGP